MAPIRIPEGFVFLNREPGIAVELLDAADEIGADRKLDVRTVSGGYHVAEKVAERFQENRELAGEGKTEPAGDPATHGDDAGAQDAAAADAEARRQQAEKEAEAAAEKKAQEDAAAAKAAETPSEEWTHDRLNEYAGKLEPALELTGSTPAKAEKVKLIQDHISKNAQASA